jgi:hypothetical protein
MTIFIQRSSLLGVSITRGSTVEIFTKFVMLVENTVNTHFRMSYVMKTFYKIVNNNKINKQR